MQDITATMQQALDETMVQARPALMGEWNYNRFSEDVVVNYWGTAALRDQDIWPLDSIVRQRYGFRGIPRWVIGESLINPITHPNKARVVGEDEQYKYWLSPTQSDEFGFIDNAEVSVEYQVNKLTTSILFVFESTFVEPIDVDVWVREQGGAWQQVADSIGVDEDGKIWLWHQGGGTWSDSFNIDNETNIEGIRFRVNRMSDESVHCHVLEAAALREVELSERVVTDTIDHQHEQSDVVMPIGYNLVDSYDVELENADGRFDPENEASDMYGLMGTNVKLYSGYEIMTTEGWEYIQTGVTWTESWNIDTESASVNVSAEDTSKFFKNIHMSEFMIRPYMEFDGVESGETVRYRIIDIVREILQRAGFNIHIFKTDNLDKTIPYVWYESSDIDVWKALDDIARTVPANFGFDEFNRFVWVDAGFIYQDTAPIMTLDASNNLISAATQFQVSANDIDIEYNVYGPEINAEGDPAPSKLWSPRDVTGLMSAPMRLNMTDSQNFVRIIGGTQQQTEENFEFWPESGLINIEGERMRYDGKEILTPHTYELQNLERGILGTEASPHVNDFSNMTVRSINGGSGSISKNRNRLRLRTTGSNNNRVSVLFDKGIDSGTYSQHYTVYGMRFMLVTNRSHNVVGMTLHSGSGGKAYIIEMRGTAFAERINYNEVYAMKQNSTGWPSRVQMGPTRGVPFRVTPGKWIDLEVVKQGSSYSVWCNGLHMFDFQDSSYSGGRLGVTARGGTQVDVDYFYAVDLNRNLDLRSHRLRDLIEGGWHSGYGSELHRRRFIVREFGPMVHEGRVFDVQYEARPALTTDVLFTNLREARIIKAAPHHFGGRFIAENASRDLTIIHGEHITTLHGEEFSYNHVFELLGWAMVVQEERREKYTDGHSIRQHGRKELTISTPWIQSHEQAKNIGMFLTNHWSRPMDIVSVEWVPNPALQTGDVVNVDYEEKGFKPTTHKYYVIGSQVSFQDGLSGILTLKRVRE